jgi:hypothetical protein
LIKELKLDETVKINNLLSDEASETDPVHSSILMYDATFRRFIEKYEYFMLISMESAKKSSFISNN